MMIQRSFPIASRTATPVVFVLMLSIAGCSTTSVETEQADESLGVSSTIAGDEAVLQNLLAQGAATPSPQREEILYRAGLLLRNLDRENDALLLIESIDTRSIPLDLAASVLLLQAQLLDAENRSQEAIEVLTRSELDKLPQLPDQPRISVHLLRAKIYLDLNVALAGARELIMADQLIPLAAVPPNHEQIWNALTSLEADTLQALSQQERRFEYQGWYELAVIGKAHQYNLDRQVIELGRWRDSWARHPAAVFMPQAMQMVETIAEERPDNIALLLPLNSTPGSVIRDGFLSAYYDVMQFGGKVPRVRFYNTSDSLDILPIYNRAVADGAELVIGPLQKDHVAQLHNVASLPVPTLALNNLENSIPLSSSLYQFSLSPENEAIQLAERAWRDGHRYAAILSPSETEDDFYQRKRDSFTDHWLSLGGHIVAQQSFNDDYTSVLEAMLDIDDSEQRMESLGELINEQLAFTQRRRQDIDFIFLIAEPGPARQINPTLAYLFAGDIPVYATQDIYSGLPRPLVDNDLNGILFVDSPWLLEFNDALKTKASQQFPQNNALNLRLQAFGVDAFRLYPRLKQLQSVPGSQLYGATGLLSLDDHNNITRELTWARVSEGLAVTE